MSAIIQVNMHEAKSQLSQLAEKVWAGERVVIARAGKPYLDLMPHLPENKDRRPGRLKGSIQIAPGFDGCNDEIADSMIPQYAIRCLPPRV